MSQSISLSKVTKPIPSVGRLDLANIDGEILHLQGWVASFNDGAIDGFSVAIDQQKITNFELILGIASPDINETYPYLNNASHAKFSIKIDLKSLKFNPRDKLITLTPLFQGREGNLLITVIEATLPLPSEEYVKIVGSDFSVAFSFLGYFIQMGGINPNSHILDIGCGCGRMAYGLAYYVNHTGRYEGFDIIENLIKWPQQEITPRHPNFQFRLVNIYNQMYHPKGEIKAIDFIFPYPDQSFDFVFLTSVFTHLPAREVRHYLDEIHRVLKPGGRCLSTWFLLDQESEKLIAQGKSIYNIVHELEEFFTNDLQNPECATGYKEALLFEWIKNRNLTVVEKYYGYWCGRDIYTSMQDILVIEKKQSLNSVRHIRNYCESKGWLDLVTIDSNQGLRIEGWVAASNVGKLENFQIKITDQEIDQFDLTLGISSPDVKTVYPDLDYSDQARFLIKIPATIAQQKQWEGKNVVLTPWFEQGIGNYLEALISPNTATNLSAVETAVVQLEKEEIIIPKLPAITDYNQSPNLQQIQANLERSKSLLTKMRSQLGMTVESQPLDSELLAEKKKTPIEPIANVDNPSKPKAQLPIITPAKSRSIQQKNPNFDPHPPLLGLPQITAEKFWELVNPVIQKQLPYLTTITPNISILTPTWNSSLDWFVETVLSVLNQSILNWEWCLVDDGSTHPQIRQILQELANLHPQIKVSLLDSNSGISGATNKAVAMATGEYICCLDHDDTLAPTALEESLIKLAEGFDAVYSDEDKIDFDGLNYVEIFTKPDWSLEYFRGVMYVGHLLCVRRELALKVGGFDSKFNGVQDYEYMLRVAEHTDNIAHIPKILYHWRKIRGSIAADHNAKADIGMIQVAAVNAHLQRLGLLAKAEPGLGPHRVNINPLPRTNYPLVSVVIGVKDTDQNFPESISKLISSTDYLNIEWLVANTTRNGNDFFVKIFDELRVNHYKIIPSQSHLLGQNLINLAKIYNLAAKYAKSDYLVFLDYIQAVITPEWLNHLLYYAERSNVGAVGGLLITGDGKVLQAGLSCDAQGEINYIMKGMPTNSDGYAGSLVCAREVSAISSSGMMVKKRDFLAVNGFNEHFVSDYQDVDLCFKLRQKGKQIIYTPRAVFQSEGWPIIKEEDKIIDQTLLLDLWAEELEKGSPFDYYPKSSSTN